MPYKDPAKAREYSRTHPRTPAQKKRLRATQKHWLSREENKVRTRASNLRSYYKNRPKSQARERRRLADPIRGPEKRAYARKRMARLRRENPDKVRKSNMAHALKKLYGLTLEQFDTLVAKQNGLCAICGRPAGKGRGGKPRRLDIDHCHKTHTVRGLLCSSCNNGLGRFDHNHRTLQRAVDYILNPPAPHILEI